MRANALSRNLAARTPLTILTAQVLFLTHKDSVGKLVFLFKSYRRVTCLATGFLYCVRTRICSQRCEDNIRLFKQHCVCGNINWIFWCSTPK